MSNRFPCLVANGKRFYFGQDLTEAEKNFGISAKQHRAEIAWVVPNQRIIETNEVILTFDVGKLMRMELLEDFDFKIPLTPYAEDWKNLDGSVFGADMTREKTTQYLSLWEQHSIRLGCKKTESGEDLLAKEFSTYSSDETDGLRAVELDWSTLGINMGKSRRAGGGGLWADGWIINFTTNRDAELYQLPIGNFRSVSAFCDEFNTAARK